MRFDLKKPCKNCPFNPADTGIRFACHERAAEIEESAYRNGFPCHLSGEYVESEDGYGDDEGYYFGDNTQHCVGFAMMTMADGEESWPGIGNDEDLAEEWASRIDWNAPHFKSSDDYFNVNPKECEG